MLVLLAIASYFAVMEARAIGEPAVSAAVLLVWLGAFGWGGFALGLYGAVPDNVWVHDHLLRPEKYLFQFGSPDSKGVSGLVAAEGLLNDRHVSAYWRLRSRRMQLSYDRVVGMLLDGFSGEDFRARAVSILEQATDIAERIIQLEEQLADQNYPALFSQLASLDAQIARSGDTDQTAELIAQKTALRGQLDKIDRDRQELKKLGQELVLVSQQLHASWREKEADFGVAL